MNDLLAFVVLFAAPLVCLMLLHVTGVRSSPTLQRVALRSPDWVLSVFALNQLKENASDIRAGWPTWVRFLNLVIVGVGVVGLFIGWLLAVLVLLDKFI